MASVEEASQGLDVPPLMVMVMLALVAVVGTAQVALEVNIQVTTAPFVKVVLVKVAELVPALTPFTCHW